MAAATFIETAPDFVLDAGTVAQALGMRIERAVAALALVDDAIRVADPGGPDASWTTLRKWDRFAGIALDAVSAKHRAESLAPGLEMESLRSRLPWEVTPRVFRWGIERLVTAGRLVRADQVVRLPSHRVALDAGAREHAALLERLLAEGGFTPPDLRQLGETTGLAARAVLEVLTVLEREGRVVRIAPELFYARAPADEALARLAAFCRAHGEITAAGFRDLIGASRKFAIAFLDWTDRTGVTLRIGDARRLRR
jgi:selenocysteine-specific elongation factor